MPWSAEMRTRNTFTQIRLNNQVWAMDYKGEDAHILDVDFVNNSCPEKLEFKPSCSTKWLPEQLGLWNCLSYWQLYGEIRMSPRNKAVKPPTENNYQCSGATKIPIYQLLTLKTGTKPGCLHLPHTFSLPHTPMLTSDLTNKVLFFFSYSLTEICKPSFSYT